jgi:hypothetical protein
MIIRLDGTVQLAQKTTEAYFIEVPAIINEDGTINMNATETKLDEKEAYYIALWGDGE